MTDLKNIIIELDDNRLAGFLLEKGGEYMREISNALDVSISYKGNKITVSGRPEDVDLASDVIRQTYGLLKKKYPLDTSDIRQAIAILSADRNAKLEDIFLDTVFITARNRHIAPRSINQKRYIEAIRKNPVVFGIGPAGTGKTYLAMAMAIASLTKKETTRIILTRPAVEAGEKLGFLPGDMYEKVNPYLRPLYDALHDMMDPDKAERLVHKGTIEVAPLAFMRGRTLNNAFVILDEAQNTTHEQMKMLLTRMGFHSKVVITGDITQTDLPKDKTSGLVEAKEILSNIPGIAFVSFDESDVVRHPVVRDIISAYNNFEAKQSKRREADNAANFK